MTDKAVQRMCRECMAHLGGPLAGNYVRWEVCMACDLDPLHDLPWWSWLWHHWKRRKRARRLAEAPVSATYPDQ